MRKIILLALVAMAGCRPTDPKQNESKINDDGFYYISCDINGELTHIAVDANNDTLYFSKKKDSLYNSYKFVVKQVEVSKIKEVIQNQVTLKNFFADRPLVQDGNSVKFLIKKGQRKIEVLYAEIDNYKDVSTTFDSLMTEIEKHPTIGK